MQTHRNAPLGLPLNRWFWILLALVIAISSTGGLAGTENTQSSNTGPTDRADCSEAPDGLVLYLPLDDAGEPVPGIAIADPATGKVLGTIESPALDWLIALRSPGMALGSIGNDRIFLINGIGQTVTELTVPPGTGPLKEWVTGMPLGSGISKTLLSDGRFVFLLDFETATLLDLHSVLPPESAGGGPVSPPFKLSAGDRYVLFWADGQEWILHTDDPTTIRSLTPGGSLGPAMFSPDGNAVVYSRSAGEKQELIYEPLDGSAPPEVIAKDRMLEGSFVKGNELIAIVNHGSLATGAPKVELLNRNTGDRRTIFTFPEDAGRIYPAPSGDRILVRAEDVLQRYTYYDIDLATGSTRIVAELTYLLVSGPTGGRWLMAYAGDDARNSMRTHFGYYRVDLETGMAVMLLTVEPDEIPINDPATPIFSHNGASALIPGKELYVFDLARGPSVRIRSGFDFGVSLSPDGCWLAVASGSNGSDFTIVLERVDGSDSLSVGRGIAPGWVEG